MKEKEDAITMRQYKCMRNIKNIGKEINWNSMKKKWYANNNSVTENKIE